MILIKILYKTTKSLEEQLVSHFPQRQIWPTRAVEVAWVSWGVLITQTKLGSRIHFQTTEKAARAGVSGGVRAISGDLWRPPSYRGIIRGGEATLASPLRALQHPTGAVPAPLHLAGVRRVVRSIKVLYIQKCYVQCHVVGRLSYKQCSARLRAVSKLMVSMPYCLYQLQQNFSSCT